MKPIPRVRMFDRPDRVRPVDSAAMQFAIEKLAPIDKLEPRSGAIIARDVEPLIMRLMGAHSARSGRTGADDVALRDRLAAAWLAVAEGLDELEATVLEAEARDRAAAAGKQPGAATAASKTKDKSMRDVVGDINKANQEFWASPK